jgi:hypothetical protein
MRPPTVIVPEGDDLNPEMQALTPGRRAFVIAKVHHGMTNAQAAIAAGYSEHSASSWGAQLAAREDVKAAMTAECRTIMHVLAPLAIRTVEDVMSDPQHKDRLKAAAMILDRTGLHAVTETHSHTHQHLSEAEMDKRILALCAELGMSPDEAKKMLIAPAEFKKNSKGVFEATETISDAEPETAFEPDFTPVTQEELDSY